MTLEEPGPSLDLSHQLRAILGILANEKSYRLLGQIADRPMTQDELKGAPGMSPTAPWAELLMLQHAGLVRTWTEGERRLYQLDLTSVRDVLRALKTQSVDAVLGPGAPGESRTAVHRFFDGPKLRTLPSKDKDKNLVLEVLLRRLPAQPQIAEKDLNAMLQEVFPDFATLRRELVDRQYLQREAGIYWLTEKGKAVRARPS